MSKEKNKQDQPTTMTDEDMVKIHAKLGLEKNPPTIGFLQAPLVFVFMFGCLVFVCSIQLAHSTNSFQLHPPVEVVDLTPEEKEVVRLERKVESGKKGFALRCASCHQSSGLGLPNAFPPLAGSEWAIKDPGLITNIILKGLKGKIIVKGETWGEVASQNMVAVPINDREIANITTYVRQAWGNDASEITEEEVSNFRAESAEQSDQWTGEQLRNLYPSSFSD